MLPTYKSLFCHLICAIFFGFSFLTIQAQVSCLNISTVNEVSVTKIEAEDYCAHFGTVNENTTDIGEGENVGYIDPEDWMSYAVNVHATGNYVIRFRLASQVSTGQFKFLVNDQEAGNIAVANTGDWQEWDDQFIMLSLDSGEQVFKLEAITGSWNINFFEIYQGQIIDAIETEDILINQIGYEQKGYKKAVLLYSGAPNETTFDVVNARGQVTFTGDIKLMGGVNGWATDDFAELEFSEATEIGKHRIMIGNEISREFEIEDDLFFKRTAIAPVNFFNGMRHINDDDKWLSFYGARNDLVDVSGGWWDATGDPGKHMSHLSYANHFNPQQIPMVVWSMLSSQADHDFGNASAAVIDEIDFGLDYLFRNVDGNGYLYLAIFDDWGGDPASREICEWGLPGNNSGRSDNYQAAMREGAGIAIAALARAASSGVTFSKTSTEYLQKAEQLYAHLKSGGSGYVTKNLEYCNNHEENIIDVYCGLLATVELYRATNNSTYLSDAQGYVDRLMNLQGASGELYSDNGKNRPFYHAADEGLPIMALYEFSLIHDYKKTEIAAFASSWINWYLDLSYDVNNPFDYVREYYKPYNGGLGSATKAYFVPHQNETGYWWQGENARLASMTAGLLRAKSLATPGFILGTDEVSALAISQLDWVLGKNPYAMCMMEGYGYKNYPSYLNGTDPKKKLNIVGGICNGITSGVTDEDNIEFMPYPVTSFENWRWVEQWLPHDAWYLLAVSTLSDLNKGTVDCYGTINGTAFEDECEVCAGGITGVVPNACVTSTNTLGEPVSLTLYPNPATDLITLSEKTVWDLFDQSGQLLKSGRSAVIVVNDIDNGVYIIRTPKGSLEFVK